LLNGIYNDVLGEGVVLVFGRIKTGSGRLMEMLASRGLRGDIPNPGRRNRRS